MEPTFEWPELQPEGFDLTQRWSNLTLVTAVGGQNKCNEEEYILHVKTNNDNKWKHMKIKGSLAQDFASPPNYDLKHPPPHPHPPPPNHLPPNQTIWAKSIERNHKVLIICLASHLLSHLMFLYCHIWCSSVVTSPLRARSIWSSLEKLKQKKHRAEVPKRSDLLFRPPHPPCF